ncbi:four-helix bundle copper-binding protein [Wukongibacter baidiensis]|uniref:four-helix bundle copper-binding protein n=1 Tax=Wukongibacter baidiensis TaxID=1723361 RepID=UPI003D7F7FB6
MHENFLRDSHKQKKDNDSNKPSFVPYNDELLKTIQGCEDTCEMMTTYVKNRSDIKSRIRQLSLLGDCADICGLTAKYIARKSEFSREIADLCANICEACGRECSKFSDPESQNCAKICLHCAKECREYARGKKKPVNAMKPMNTKKPMKTMMPRYPMMF